MGLRLAAAVDAHAQDSPKNTAGDKGTVLESAVNLVRLCASAVAKRANYAKPVWQVCVPKCVPSPLSH
ncbi:hypothetical protein CfE428DRAFT_1432 [Chthoniobacter flavus Ellin428]|uniref:Uncharacterized protein n=1 Tax=Chthoniobacter flavus Ellin428 TaxID=497964 RepID=B4CXZ1_9BACT|nr:hypothetical protein CfE428DRAFT_1432 [Chthoniobacter flavus Ellin428]